MNLTDIEEMMIAWVMPLMQVRYTKGHQLCYKEHIVNLPQDISAIATKLPCLAEDCDVVIIHREGVDMTNHVDFIVCCDKVRDALQWKITHDPNYQDLQVDDNVLSLLPERGSVVDCIPTCGQRMQKELAAGPSGPNQVAQPHLPTDFDQEDDDSDVHQASGGLLHLGNDRRLEVDHVCTGVSAVVFPMISAN